MARRKKSPKRPTFKKVTFFEKADQRNLAQLTTELAQFIHDKDITQVLLPDTAGRLAYIAVRQYFADHFPDSDQPNFYFFDPKAFGNGSDPALFDEFQGTYQFDPSARTLAFDACYHSGETFDLMRRLFTQAGIENVLLGVGSEPEVGKHIPVGIGGFIHHYETIPPPRIPPDLAFVYSGDSHLCYHFAGGKVLGSWLGAKRANPPQLTLEASRDPKDIFYAQEIRAQVKDAVRKYAQPPLRKTG